MNTNANLTQTQHWGLADQAAPLFSHVTFLGLGMMGGSFLMAIRDLLPGTHIQAYDVDPKPLQEGIRARLLDRGCLTLQDLHFEGPHHLVVLASHLNANLANFNAVLTHSQCGGHLLITDLGSCKRGIAEHAQHTIPDDGPLFVPGHPLAGREKSGLHASTDLLFMGKKWILCPTARVPEVHPAFRRLSALISQTGAKVASMDPAAHDQLMALMSHLPQLYATTLGGILFNHQPARVLRYTGGGIDDQLRLTGSSGVMWEQVFRENADNMVVLLDELIDRLSTVRDALKQPQEDPTQVIRPLFDQANQMYELYNRLKQQG